MRLSPSKDYSNPQFSEWVGCILNICVNAFMLNDLKNGYSSMSLGSSSVTFADSKLQLLQRYVTRSQVTKNILFTLIPIVMKFLLNRFLSKRCSPACPIFKMEKHLNIHETVSRRILLKVTYSRCKRYGEYRLHQQKYMAHWPPTEEMGGWAEAGCCSS